MRSAPCSRQPATAPSPTSPAPKTTHVDPGCTFAVFIAAPSPVERPHAKTHARSSGASGEIFASAISGHDRVLREGRRPHEVADRLAAARKARRAVGEVALVLLLADREAEVRPGVEAVDALAALRREERDDVVAGRDRRRRRRRLARRRRRLRGRAPSARSPTGRRPRRCRGRCGRRRRRRAGRAPHPPAARRARPPGSASGAPNSRELRPGYALVAIIVELSGPRSDPSLRCATPCPSWRRSSRPRTT